MTNIEIRDKTYNIVTLDFETFYSAEYTLSGRANVSEYVRDKRFKVHGVSIKIGDAPAKWFHGSAIKRQFAKINWANTALLAHNTAFDGFILSEHYSRIPGLYLDTLSMARAAHGHHMRHNLDTLAKHHGLAGKVKKSALVNTKGKRVLQPKELEALGAYACDDVNDTYTIFNAIYPYIPDDEIRLIDLTIRMFTEPILLIDEKRINRSRNKEIEAKKQAKAAANVDTDDLMSNDRFAAKLRALGCKIPFKVSKRTGCITYAFAVTDAAFKALGEHENPKVRALYNARVTTKSTISVTRAERMLAAGKDGARLPILLNYSGAHTHRWSGGNKMNLQNLQRGGELRKSIIAPFGYRIVVADSAQIEARVLAWIAGQKNIVEAFANKEDVYKIMASRIYRRAVETITKEERFIGKVCVLGLGYGMGPQRLRETLRQGILGPPVDLSEDVCTRIVSIYRQSNTKIRAFWKKMEDAIIVMYSGASIRIGPLEVGKGFIRLPNGLFLQYPELECTLDTGMDGNVFLSNASYLTRTGRSKLYGGLLTENVVQALSRIIIAEQMLAINDLGYKIATMTHDEIVTCVETRLANKALKDMLKIMSTSPPWASGLPLAAEGSMAENYSK